MLRRKMNKYTGGKIQEEMDLFLKIENILTYLNLKGGKMAQFIEKCFWTRVGNISLQRILAIYCTSRKQEQMNKEKHVL